MKKALLLSCFILFSTQIACASDLWNFYEEYSEEYKANTKTIEDVSHRVVEVLTNKQEEKEIVQALLLQTSRCLSPEVDPSAEVLQQGVAALEQLNQHNNRALSLLSIAGLDALRQIPENNPWARFNLLSILANAAHIYEEEYDEEDSQNQLNDGDTKEGECQAESDSDKKNGSSGKNSTAGSVNCEQQK